MYPAYLKWCHIDLLELLLDLYKMPQLFTFGLRLPLIKFLEIKMIGATNS